jgi:hypothetical protein
MSYNAYLYDKLCEERRQTLQHEMAQRRMLTGIIRRKGMGRGVIGRLGVALVAVGTRLEQFDHHSEPVMPGVDR